MSLNAFMHPRNIYRTKPDFAQMAVNYPSFGTFVRLDLSGKVTIDYNDCNALRQLTATLLKKDFDLDVDIPINRLIPTVPQRLNYVLWIEDLVSKLTQFLQIEDKDIIGLDVGTGSCAIFPLITSTIKKNWRFVATDVDPFNIESALKNVNQNDLNHRIKIIESKDGTIFGSVMAAMSGERVHYMMTNPPFFSDNFNDSTNSCDETDIKCDSHVSDPQIKTNRNSRKKSAANTSISTESIVEGGEVAFVTKIIDESLRLRDYVMIYSAMFGKKRSLLEIKNIIKQYVEKGLITSFISTEFCQGITKRWGIAWTFINGLNLEEVPSIKGIKLKPPLVYYLPPLMNECKYDLQSIAERINFLLVNDLQMDSFVVKENRKSIQFLIKANKNTWSNQRRKRREAKFKQHLDSTIDTNTLSSNDKCFDLNNQKIGHKIEDHFEMEFTNDSNSKRKIDEEIDCSQESMECQIKKSKTRTEYCVNPLYLLDCSLIIKRDKQSILIQLQTKELAINKESTYQLLQYFKNKLI